MKIKRLCSAVLVAALICGLLCTPALAMEPGNAAEILTEGRLWLDTADWQEETDALVKLLDPSPEGGGGPKLYTVKIHTLNYIPLGATFSAGPDYPLYTMTAYSDPDGDGIYELRMNTYDAQGDGAILPTGGNSAGTFSNYLRWGTGKNCLNPFAEIGGYRTLTTDYLVELFGANTIIMFANSEHSQCFLLTGEPQAEGLDGDPTELYGVSITEDGYLCSSGWAPEVVDEAVRYNLIPLYVQQNRRFNLRGYITRGEFAAIAVRLYAAMSGEEPYYTDDSPFSDVEPDTDEYKFIMAARDLGIVNGTSTTANTFSPNALVKRQDAALMLARVYKILGGTIPTGASTTFSDNAAIRADAMDAVAFMSAHGILNGVGNNRFAPTNGATIEQALKIAVYMLDNLEV